MELREIMTFLQVAQQKSFSKAARQLGYSQAAVTIQIKQLEKELNVRLFDRIGKQTTLTHQGNVFYHHAVSIIQDLENARDAVKKTSELTGRLCIGTIESICSSILPWLLEKYHSLYPGVNVSIITDSPGALLDMMNSNAIDIVYFMDKRMYDSKWIKVLEEPEDIVFVASREHPFAERGILNLNEVIAQPFILTEKNASYRFILDQFLASRNLEIKPFLEIGNTEFIIKLLRSNLGLSFLPEFTVHRDITSGLLCTLPVKDFYMRTWRQIVYHKDKWLTREMSSFIELAASIKPPA
ncbi:MAG: LysR family transcriptional regulator [Clostridium sp.]|nr:LysR family transcriptional regulator [Clostridium sp.]